jgi:secondary thiamine-phosphate synthase enzyme
MWLQKTLTLIPRARGFHLVTREIMEQLPELGDFHVGLAHFFLLHTSASLTINENADPDVRRDMERQFQELIPEGAPFFTHVMEGDDDMPAHVKSSLLGVSLMVPIAQGRLKLGTWQGIYLGEHRDHGGRRQLVVTLNGES